MPEFCHGLNSVNRTFWRILKSVILTRRAFSVPGIDRSGRLVSTGKTVSGNETGKYRDSGQRFTGTGAAF